MERQGCSYSQRRSATRALHPPCHTSTQLLRNRAAGRIYDAEGVGRVTSEHGVPFLLDACQSAGQMPLDVAALRCDWLTGTARKYLRGPRGVGFLYASTCAPMHMLLETARAWSRARGPTQMHLSAAEQLIRRG